MHIAIVGAAGMLGSKLTKKLLEISKLQGRDISRLSLYDAVAAPRPSHSSIETSTLCLDFASLNGAQLIVSEKPDVIFHLAAIVSGEAEIEFDKGYRINLDGTRYLLEAIRHLNEQQGYFPRLVFASSIAVFGAPLPDPIPDSFHHTPLTSYGTQKAISELLLSDYSRHGFVDGIGLRLPTLCIRPGIPNKAASGFFSSILREPLQGLPAILPVSPSVKHWHTSPRSAVNFLLHAAGLDTRLLGWRRNLTLPGVSATVEEQIDALRRIAGEDAVKLIQHKVDPAIEKMVTGWAPGFEATRALELGFKSEQSFDEIIHAYVEDDLQVQS
ncbi:SDR family oxidoreductase [Paenalcaligenes niemegkensis]|uniref:D-erythronate dehydrogenase n=1 Tax=Paenalcaligenes niemegkensis TaxID=2895469 RepID=UPI001EE87EB4|nr:D-erythronate dehydrogenase [Paenalcaligenes niemegkensis]MCQ9618323.1 SDR family oxidoreductase [Paenalcaligenes niemegkensis]